MQNHKITLNRNQFFCSIRYGYTLTLKYTHGDGIQVPTIHIS